MGVHYQNIVELITIDNSATNNQFRVSSLADKTSGGIFRNIMNFFAKISRMALPKYPKVIFPSFFVTHLSEDGIL